MIGKKSSIAPLKAKLGQIDGVSYSVMTFCQGKTQRWALAWTFHDNMRLKVADSFVRVLLENIPSFVSVFCRWTCAKKLNKLRKFLNFPFPSPPIDSDSIKAKPVNA